MSDTVRVDTTEPGIAVVTIDRPHARNALDVKTVAALGRTMAAADVDPTVRAIVLTGADGNFCVGSDIKEMLREGISCLRSDDRVTGWNAIENLETPWIAAVDGMALGAGLELALMADMLICSEGACVGLPEVKIGVMPGDGGTQRLSRLVGQQAAMRLILTGEILPATEAVRLGVALPSSRGQVALDAALDVARKIAKNAPLACRLARDAVRRGLEMSLNDGMRLEAAHLAKLFKTRDQQEGMSAFTEKRAPEFTGR
jgi:enoyl-CoA hydratase